MEKGRENALGLTLTGVAQGMRVEPQANRLIGQIKTELPVEVPVKGSRQVHVVQLWLSLNHFNGVCFRSWFERMQSTTVGKAQQQEREAETAGHAVLLSARN